MEKSKAFFSKKGVSIALILVISNIILINSSCNNGSTQKENGNTDTTQALMGGAHANLIKVFHPYKIEKQTLMNLYQPPQGQQAYQKLILVINFDNIVDPSVMNLNYYPATLGGQAIGSPQAIATDPSTVPSPGSNLLICNNELVLSNYMDDHGNWMDFDYLLLTPQNNNGSLGFGVSAYKNGSLQTLPNAAQNTNPSPPAKPSILKKMKS